MTGTTLPEAREALYQFFQDGWTPDAGETGWKLDPADQGQTKWIADAADQGARLPYTFDNERLDPPAGIWTRFTVRHSNRAQETIGEEGRRKFGSRARCFLEFFEKPGVGVGTVDEHMAKGLSIFEGKRIAGTTIRVVQAIPRERGVGGDERNWESYLEIIVDYDEQK